jgi:hypothetical protein
MAINRRSTIQTVAAQVSQALTNAGITAVLTGGGAVSVYSANKYQSHDIDFVTAASRRELSSVMAGLGFVQGAGRHFEHPRTKLVIEFVAWPVTVGDEVVRKWASVRTTAGTLQILTPSQCIKDRLAAFYHWRDSQSLEQALLVAKSNRVSMTDLARWSRAEGHADDYEEFRRRLRTIRRGPVVGSTRRSSRSG